MKQRLSALLGTPRELASDCVYDLIGGVLYSVGLILFARPAGFAMGGVSGLALLIDHFFHLPVGLVTLVLNIPLILFSRRVMGHRFLARSIVTLVILTILEDLVFAPLPCYIGDSLLAALLCGALMGAGLGLIYGQGSSTGGTDLLILPLHRLLPRFSVPVLTVLIDGSIIVFGGIIYRNINSMLYGIVQVAVCSLVMDRVLSGASREKLALIITDNGAAVAAALSESIGRGATLLPATGAFTGQAHEMVLCACSPRQAAALRQCVHAADPAALLMLTDVTEAYGEGFRPPQSELP